MEPPYKDPSLLFAADPVVDYSYPVCVCVSYACVPALPSPLETLPEGHGISPPTPPRHVKAGTELNDTPFQIPVS